jgi:uncharacterized heparinase superfamily protein
MRRAALYWNTLRHLQARQLANRLWRRIYRPTIAEAPEFTVRTPGGAWCIPARRDQSMLDAFTFRFLNQDVRIEPGGWHHSGESALWRYNLHYFDDLNAEAAGSRTLWHRAAVDDWISSVRPGDSPGWDPYPTSLRIVNWVKWLQSSSVSISNWTRSLAMQATGLEKRLEFHLGGNHLFSNAKALVFAGAFFEGNRAMRWMQTGLSILEREIRRQILSDGGHYERTPMYHALALEDILDLINILRRYPGAVPDRSRAFVSTLSGIASRMEAALDLMCHPDGEIASFNDASRGVAPKPAELRRYARALGIRQPGRMGAVNRLAETGYLKLISGDVVAILDIAPVGPDELPGHAHADTLSFELSIGGNRVLVNGGTSTYEVGDIRQRERGTAAHNTVTIDGEDSSEVWASFRVARRAKVFDIDAAETPDGVLISASHDGYKRLPGRPIHRRTWSLKPNRLVVDDRVTGRFKSAVARFHLQSAVRCDLDDTARTGRLVLPGGREVHWRSNVTVRLEPSTYSPRFGVRESTQCIALSLAAEGALCLELNW